MYVDLLAVIKEILSGAGCPGDKSVYLDTRPQGTAEIHDLARQVEYECENGMRLVVDYDNLDRILGVEVWLVESDQRDEPSRVPPPTGRD